MVYAVLMPNGLKSVIPDRLKPRITPRWFNAAARFDFDNSSKKSKMKYSIDDKSRTKKSIV